MGLEIGEEGALRGLFWLNIALRVVFRHEINSDRFRTKSYTNFSVKIADSRWSGLILGSGLQVIFFLEFYPISLIIGRGAYSLYTSF